MSFAIHIAMPCSSLLAAAEPGSTKSVLQHFVTDGGPITWFALIPLSVVSIALIIFSLLTIRRGAQVPSSLARALVAGARQGQSESVLEITRDDDTLLAQAAHAGLLAQQRGHDQALTAVDEAVEQRVGRLFRRIEYLNVIGNVSPMIGLLGTVVGMIQAFNRIYAAGGAVPEASKLVGDIAIALVNTFWGLFIAIPALSAYAMFRNRIDAYAAESVKLCDAMLGMLADRGPRVARTAVPTAAAG